MNRDNLRAFTLVELLVVIAIIGVLVALLLPAVQAARESARRSTCTNHLKQIGVAVANFESSRKHLPAGADWDPGKIARGSVLIFLLPYIEQQSVFDAYDFKQTDIDNAMYPGTSARIGDTPIDTYKCPSDSYDVVTWPLHSYAASRGPTALAENPELRCDFPWSNLAMAPDGDRRTFAGPFTRLGTETKLRQITDGLSNTLLFGEVRPTCSSHAMNGWAKTNNGNGYCSTLVPINYDTCDPQASDPCGQASNWNTEAGFRSTHSGGAFFLLGDGSVHFLKEDIDHQMYQYLGAKNDSQPIRDAI